MKKQKKQSQLIAVEELDQTENIQEQSKTPRKYSKKSTNPF